MSQLLELELVLLVSEPWLKIVLSHFGVGALNLYWNRSVQEELDYSLIVFSPYRDLIQFLQDPRVACLAEFAW